VNNEVNIENDVNKKLNGIIEQQIQVIQKQKRVVAKCHQDNEAAKQKHQVRPFISVNYISFMLAKKFAKFLKTLFMENSFTTIFVCFFTFF
jgi:hypothetical protein